ncbi:MAG: VCBS repeat-containing protein [Planctomycetota bacterium]|nr:MAG: VCBS repeat-containing protein [Planctomycetota bacterium]
MISQGPTVRQGDHRGMKSRTRLSILALIPCVIAGAVEVRGQPWRRHTIDDGSRGADGVRPGDVNGDGLLDLVSAWEEGGQIRLYLNPGTSDVRKPWPLVVVGRVGSPEDAVLVDLDGDGGFDVISSCEGRTRTMSVHWGPRDSSRVLEESAWETETIPATVDMGQWMYCVPFDFDGRHGIDLVAGSKGESARIGCLVSPANPRRVEDWVWMPLYKAGWIMSLESADVDRDGDADLLLTDRKGPTRGCKWLENPGAAVALTDDWVVHTIGGTDHEVMFADVGDFDSDGKLEVACATRDDGVLMFRQTRESGDEWTVTSVSMPPGTGTGKAVRLADVDGDGRTDVVVSCENAKNVSGVFWMSQDGPSDQPEWNSHEISGPQGTKFDLIQLIDLDADGDLDVLTCEERENLGVIWYENSPR